MISSYKRLNLPDEQLGNVDSGNIVSVQDHSARESCTNITLENHVMRPLVITSVIHWNLIWRLNEVQTPVDTSDQLIYPFFEELQLRVANAYVPRNMFVNLMNFMLSTRYYFSVLELS